MPILQLGVNLEKLTPIKFMFGYGQQQHSLHFWKIRSNDLPGGWVTRGGARIQGTGRLGGAVDLGGTP